MRVTFLLAIDSLDVRVALKQSHLGDGWAVVVLGQTQASCWSWFIREQAKRGACARGQLTPIVADTQSCPRRSCSCK
jgi:hypothetical protein